MKSTIKSDQIGSLIRPDKLHDVRDAFHEGRVGIEVLRQAEDEAILEALSHQKQAGLDVFTDGEMRRDAWQTNFSEAVEGFESEYPVRDIELADGRKVQLELHTKAVVGKLKQLRRLTEVDASFLSKNAPGPWKITMPGATTIARGSWRKGVDAYPSVRDLQEDVASIIRGEMQALVDQGVSYIQLDESFTAYARAKAVEDMRAAGNDPEAMIVQDIEFENSCYDAVRSSGVILGAHLCRGSRFAGPKPTLTDPDRGGDDFDWLAEHLLQQLHVDRFLFEWDSSFEALRFLPPDKTMVLGIVSSLHPTLESQDLVLRCVERASKYCSLDQLALSSQCGFSGSGTRDGAHMTVDEEKRKLEFIAETAQKVWG